MEKEQIIILEDLKKKEKYIIFGSYSTTTRLPNGDIRVCFEGQRRDYFSEDEIKDFAKNNNLYWWKIYPDE